jgi:antitoxin component YwqK of YwqJK toxin-antitoxin module
VFVLMAHFSYSQEKIIKIYYDKDWKGVSNASFAAFYRIAVYPTNQNYKKRCRDYFITGELQGESEFVSIDKFDDSKSVWNGEVITYYKNGKIATKETWKNGKSDGEFCSFSENGLIKSKGKLFNGKLDGLYTEFFDDGTFLQAEYINGISKYEYYVKSNQNGQLIKIKNSDDMPLWESPSVSERKTLYQDGTPWQYYEKNGLIISQTNTTIRDYGKWHRIDLIITNNSMLPIEFDPERNIVSFSTDKKGVKKDLVVLSCDSYMKKVARGQVWSAIAVGLAEGLSTMDAGYSKSTTTSTTYYNGSSSSSGSASAYGSGGYAFGSYSGNSSYSGSVFGSSSTTTYDAYAAYQARVLSQERMADFSDSLSRESSAKQMGYLKRNTINPGETIQGYVHIQRISGTSVFITININEAEYTYGWNYGK